MGESMEDIKNTLKRALKKGGKKVIIIILIVMIVFFFLSAALYFVTVDDGTYKEEDWSSTNYGASVYANAVTVNVSNGKLSNSSMSIQKLWEEMKKNGSRVDQYLDKPEELAKLIRAEIVTQYPDTRENPDEKIEWDKIGEDDLQGIIKFKRADGEGNKSNMTYVDPETFQGYIDEYNESGSETAKKNALSHFTLKKSTASTSVNNGGAIAAGEGVMTDVSQAIIDATNYTTWPGVNLCAKWVDDVYDNAGVRACRHDTAYLSSQHHMISTDMSAIPIGAAVYGTGHNSGGAGHIGIYIGDGQVVDSQSSSVVVSNISDWLSWQTDVIEGKQGWIGWGWEDGNTIRGTTQDPSVKQKNTTSNQNKNSEKDAGKTTQKATEKSVSGDGYNQEYTSSAGITYKHYKQYDEKYNNISYWEGTIQSHGCGPSSVAILASGLTNLNYTPRDVAAEMMARHSIDCTKPDYLKEEMDSLGMQSEIIYNPSAETIQDNLRNGKVMLVSVDNNTIFTDLSHIMAIVDINDSGQVYICNPGSSSLYGWYDISEITKGCQYIVVTSAGAAGIAKSTNNSNYVAVVATWKQVDTKIKTNDPEVQATYGIDDKEETVSKKYYMSTTNVNYEEMVEPYTVPFDLLWAFLVVGEEKEFVFDIADLIYNSDIQITIHDNLTVNTDIDNWNYKQETKAVVDWEITGECRGVTSTRIVKNHEHDPYEEAGKPEYNTIKTVITKTNTINTALTRANVWIVDYKNEYTYVEPYSSGPNTQEPIQKPDQEYSSEPSSTGTTWHCEKVDEDKKAIKEEVEERVKQNLQNEFQKELENLQEELEKNNSLLTKIKNNKFIKELAKTKVIKEIEKTIEELEEKIKDIRLKMNTALLVTTYPVEEYNVRYYTRYVEISDTITNTVETQKYTQGVPEIKEKTERNSDEPNFVTIFNKKEHRKNRKNMNSVPSWLFEIIETNDSTADMIDLIKYLLYKATGTSYGVESFDFNTVFGKNLVTVGEGDYIVNIDMSPSEIVITDLNKLKQAFSWYSRDEVLQQYADYFLKFQEQYRVNAVFAAAVSITESSAGTNIAIGGNNMFSISNGGQRKLEPI